MKVAYFSTATAIGSCSSYWRLTISGGLLMTEICFLLFFLFLLGLTRRRQNTWRTENHPVHWAGATATVTVATKWGRSSPFRWFDRVQNECRAMRNLYAPNNFATSWG